MTYATTAIDLSSTTPASSREASASPRPGTMRSRTTVSPGEPSQATAAHGNTVGSSAVARTASAADIAIRDLSRYGGFPRGWDGYDGEPFQAAVVEDAVALVRALSTSFLRARTEPGDITPGPISDGRIDVETSCGERRLIVTLEAGADTVGVFCNERGSTSERLARWNSDDLGQWIRWVTGEDRLSAQVHHTARATR